jgi:hypothetical protein
MLEVPFLCQSQARVPSGVAPQLPDGVTWDKRACAIACATMVINYFGRQVSVGEVLDTALATKAYDPTRGWLHSGLVEVIQSFGLTAYRRNWRLLDGHEPAYLAGRSVTAAAQNELAIVARQMLEEGVATIERLLKAEVPITISIYRPSGDRSSAGHQVVLLAIDKHSVCLHDPVREDGAAIIYERDSLFSDWKGTAIVAHLPDFVIPSTS